MSLDVLSVFPMTAAVDARGCLSIGGCDVVELAARFGTPLYLFDEETLRAQCRAHVAEFTSRYPTVHIYYAAKAYLGVRLAQLMCEEDLSLDVVSAGELHIARVGGFPAQRICLHGNNKPTAELATALDAGVGRIAVDNLDELALLSAIAEQKRIVAPILLRLAPSVDPHTHRYISTGVADSKFGLPIVTGMAGEAVARALSSPWLKLHGYHTHIGSQIHDLDAYRRTIEALFGFAADMGKRHGYVPEEVSLGGGWAVPYAPNEHAPAIAEVAALISHTVQEACARYRLALPALSVEPGRALVARAGVALYSVGGTKDIHTVKRYVFVDGGMADNIRPALYGARYTAVLGNRMLDEPQGLVTIAGRYCESGDILIEDAVLPEAHTGDIVAIAMAGAYTLSMSSNYNAALRPAVVAVSAGRATVWRRRETLDDLVRLDAA